MQNTALTPKQSLNKAYLKEKVTRADIELFKKNLVEFLGNINEKESEEHVKNLVTKFLYDTYYNGKNKINTSDRIDLAIFEDHKPVVIFEAKRPSSTDMVSVDDLNTKAIHELILYYLQERVDHGNIDIKHLVITNTYEWFIFDSSVFDNLFYRDKAFMTEFVDWKNGRKARPDRDFFYNEIAKPFLKKLKEEIKFSWFDLTKLSGYAKNKNSKDDVKLIDIFKILSPAHLLKQPFANDSNSLDTKFYSELLHIIGLEEKKEGGKKLIQRKDNPESGSLIENTINSLIAEDRLHMLPRGGADYGNKPEERLFNVALELCITWINRVLFLKLLEGQLLTYHGGDNSYRFLDSKTIPNYDELNKLFFQVLARKESDRAAAIRSKFATVPYLNSSLFDTTTLEDDALRINSLDDGLKLQIIGSTVLKTENGKKRTGELAALQYLLEFLDAYDFSSEGQDEIQEENKTLINASVLGLIFEKINGYKDGSFFTPGFITMYMCRETIRKAVVQKFNVIKNWTLESFDQLYNKIEDKKEANEIVNSLKVCDPAVGSGHFLVSALNELIAIKSELGILSDINGKILRDYSVEVVNDELMVSTGYNEFFEYKPGNKECQRVQEALFHEKQTLIENCLFGVDINPNSVKICRLRLWIELLKNAYYTSGSKYKELETLPNIDINIKQGNSLVSRFSLDADLTTALRKSRWNIDTYRVAIHNYHHANTKEEKRQIESLIDSIKTNFETEIGNYSDPRKKRIAKLGEQLFKLTGKGSDGRSVMLFDGELDIDKKDGRASKRKKEIEKIETEINKLTAEIEEVKNSVTYRNAFEWRFEFPEILNTEGEFVGFDAIIGNPPYGTLLEENSKKYFKLNYSTVEGPFEVYKFFIERGISILKSNGFISFITPDTWTNLSYFKKLRKLMLRDNTLGICSDTLYDVFDEATVDNNISLLKKTLPVVNSFSIVDDKLEFIGEGTIDLDTEDLLVILKAKPALIGKIEKKSDKVSDVLEVWRGMSAYGAADPEKPFNSRLKETEFHRPLLNGGDIGKYAINWDGDFIKYGDWLHRPRPSFIYDRPHILVQRIRNPRLKDRIVAALDENKFISSDGLSNLILKSETEDLPLLKAITAILNSKLINYWFSFYYFDVNIKPEQLRQIPLKVSSKTKAQLSSLVDKIHLSAKDSAVRQKTINEIDSLIYKLYELDEQEIKVVDEFNA